MSVLEHSDFLAGWASDSDADSVQSFASDEAALLSDLIATVVPDRQPTKEADIKEPQSIKEAETARETVETDIETDVPDIEDHEYLRLARSVARVAASQPPDVHSPRELRGARPVLRARNTQEHHRKPVLTPEPKIAIKIEDDPTGDATIKTEDDHEKRDATIKTEDPKTADVKVDLEDPATSKQSPLARFRHPPMKSLSVSDLVSPAWCELKYFYSLTTHGRVRRTPAMRRGTVVHQKLESEVHTPVPVEITTREDAWALRIWNVIYGLRTLRDTGMTREMEVWGIVGGEVVVGVIDLLSTDVPEGVEEPEEERIYLTDVKTRNAGGLPSVKSAGFRSPRMQLQLYYHMLSRLVDGEEISIDDIAGRFSLNTTQPLSDAFLAQVGSINDDYFEEDACSWTQSSQNTDADEEPPPSSSRHDSLTVLLNHNSLSHLWDLLRENLRLTFLRYPEPASTPTPACAEDAKPVNILSPLLTVSYMSPVPGDGEGEYVPVGSRSFDFDPASLHPYLEAQMEWWRGQRAPRGVPLAESWKCQSCEFRDQCGWRARQFELHLAGVRARRGDS